jgi:hypothetical protein
VTPEEAMAVVAARAVSAEILTAIACESIEWADYPEIGEGDWSGVELAVASVAESLAPSAQQYAEAYALLAGRADS